QVGWASNNSTFAAVTTGGDVGIYSFDGSNLTLTKSETHGSALYTLAWPQGGAFQNYLAVAGAAGTGGYEGTIYTFGANIPTNHTITNNLVNQVTTAAGYGVGIRADSSVNYVAQNTSCDNNTNFQGVANQYLDSQANARGVDNVDCSLTKPDQITQILNETWSIESKAEVISSKLDTIGGGSTNELWSIESKCEVICSKIDIPAPCAATPITSGGLIDGKSPISISTTPARLTQSGYYCLAQDIYVPETGTGITISGNNITLDLNGYTIYSDPTQSGLPAAVGINIAGNQVTVRNGSIKGQSIPGTLALAQGINLVGNNCVLENIEVVDTTVAGFSLQSTNNNNILNCRAINSGTAGFQLTA
ncbi:MAG: hypothetical protein U1E13_11040, partial [Methylophilaceae bacterium]|nr:hypothetical protein [Methylophilaceae bacterium]